MAEVDTTALSGTPPDPAYRERYPWHARPWATLTQNLARLPHAMLLHGPRGLGKRAFAWRLAHSLLCTERVAGAAACGRCQSCALFEAGTHPDLLFIEPLEDSVTITIDQVRAVHDFLALRPHTASHKLVLLMPADAMNVNAANALLKVLEEPPAGGLLILATDQLTRLPATIRSRCSAVAFRPPSSAEASEWLGRQGVTGDISDLLQQAGGAPLNALAATRATGGVNYDELRKDVEGLQVGKEDPLRCASRWKTAGAKPCLEWFQQYVAQIIRQVMTENNDKFKININNLFDFSDVISSARNALNGPLDETLLLEDVLLEWHRISRAMN